jgi:hypothetical protein
MADPEATNPETSGTFTSAPSSPSGSSGRNRTTAGSGIKLAAPTFQIAIPDLRNGSLVNIQQAAPKAAMSGLYHWPIIGALTHEKYIEAIDLIVRAIYAQGLHMLGGSADTAAAADFRKKAMVLAGVRIGAVSAFKLTKQDLVINELAASGMVYDAASDSIGENSSGSTSSARWTAAKSMEDITTTEMDVISACIYMGMAVPVLQGVSLVMTGHHYIPTTYNLFRGLKRQALGQAPKDAATWIEAMGENFDDMAFHKATHSVSFNLKRSLAKDTAVAHRLKASGHGSAAIRLPAVPSEASGGKASIALLGAAAPTLVDMGGSIDYSSGVQLLLDLETATPGTDEALKCDAVVAWVVKNVKVIAMCAGIVAHVHETQGTGKNTILVAYSIKRIMAENPAEVSKGMMLSRAANTRLREAMERGEFTVGNLVL